MPLREALRKAATPGTRQTALASSVAMPMGGNVQGGRMVGPQVKLTGETLNQQRDLPVLTDYRGLIGGIVQRQYGLGADRLTTVFPGTKPIPLGLV